MNGIAQGTLFDLRSDRPHMRPTRRAARRAGLEAAAPRLGTLAARYLELLEHRGRLGLTDHEAGELLQCLNTSVCAVRAHRLVRARIATAGTRTGPYGVANAITVLRRFATT